MEGQLNLTDCSCPTVQVVVWAKYILEEVSIPVVGTVGLLGNLAAIIVLSHPDMKSTFHQSLITLAVFEIMFLLLVICDHALDISSQFYILMFPYFLYPMENILLSCESYLLMSIALERLIAVVRPIWYRTTRLRLSGWKHAAVFILPTLLLSISFNIPKFFELELVYTNVTDSSNTVREVRDFEVTSLRLDSDYILYYIHLTRSLCTGVLPIVFLLVTNTCIYLSLRRQRASPPPSLSEERHNSVATLRSNRKFSVFSDLLGSTSDQREISILLSEEQISQNNKALSHSALTLTAIVIMYILCNIPRLVLNMAEYLYQSQLYEDYDKCGCVKNKVWIEITVRQGRIF